MDKLARSEKTIGTWNLINSPLLVEVIASSGIDFLIIDAEHGNFTYETAQILVSICELYRVSPIMRVGEVNESLILRALDIGVHGIQVPNIKTVDDARLLVKFSKYPPNGLRGFSPYTKAGLFDLKNSEKLLKNANKNTIVIANIEDLTGLENIDDICKVNGLDIIFIGLFDLSKSLGIPGDIQNDLVLERLDRAIELVHSNNKKIGSIASSLDMLEILKKKGVDYITYSVDTGVVKESYMRVIDKFKEWV